MTIKSISGFNFAGYSSVMVNLDENINYLIGPNGHGKTTLGLNLLWFILQGIAEKSSDGKIPLLGERFRFIGDGGATAMGELVMHDDLLNVDIRIIRKLTKAGTELTFSAPVGYKTPDGNPLDQQWLNSLFNIFLIAPKRFINLSSRDQALALCIDTEKWNQPIRDLKEKFTEINRVLKSLEKLEEVEPVEKAPMEALQKRKAEIKANWNDQYLSNQSVNKATRLAWEEEKKRIDANVIEFNKSVDLIEKAIKECNAANEVLQSYDCISVEVEQFLNGLKSKLKFKKIAEELYPPAPTNLQDMPEGYQPKEGELVYIIELPDDTEMVGIDAKILTAAETNERASLYETYLQKLTLRGEKEIELNANKEAVAKLEGERLEYVKGFKFPFPKLSVDDEGGLLMDDKPLKDPYFSTGELIRIVPTLMAAQNPELKYVFIQEANLLDEDNLARIEKDLTAKGFQLVFEMVGKKEVMDRNCIMLRDCSVVHNMPGGFQTDSFGKIEMQGHKVSS